MKLKQKIPYLSRYLSAAVLVLVQLSVLILAFLFFRRTFGWFYLFCVLLSVLLVGYIIREDINPTYKIPWIILMLLVPFFGGPFYLMFGKVRFSREEKRRQERLREDITAVAKDNSALLDQVPNELRPQCSYLQNTAKAPVYKNTSVEFFPLGEDYFRRLCEELRKAEKYIFLEYFIIAPGTVWDTVLGILKERAQKGVDVRLIYDDIGSFGLLPEHYDKELEQEGISCLAFHKLRNIFSARFQNRDHRKICIIDGNTAFTGGINLADEYINAYQKHGHWKDTGIMLKGEAVYSMTMMFLSLWDYERKQREDYHAFLPDIIVEGEGFVQPYADSPGDREYVGETVYRNILGRAKDYVYITTPYLIIDNVMVEALSAAAKSGVDVRIITPGIPDKKAVFLLTRSFYHVLLEAGVRIYEYTPGFIHAKEFISDDRVATVGTVNLDYRSLCHHFECGVWMCDNKAVGEIKEDFLSLLPKCREITKSICKKEMNRYPLLLSILRLFAPLF